jgi:hypothetical protein
MFQLSNNDIRLLLLVGDGFQCKRYFYSVSISINIFHCFKTFNGLQYLVKIDDFNTKISGFMANILFGYFLWTFSAIGENFKKLENEIIQRINGSTHVSRDLSHQNLLQLQFFALEIINHPIKIEIFKIFRIDNKLLNEISTIGIAYVVVLLQFELGV